MKCIYIRFPCFFSCEKINFYFIKRKSSWCMNYLSSRWWYIIRITCWIKYRFMIWRLNSKSLYLLSEFIDYRSTDSESEKPFIVPKSREYIVLMKKLTQCAFWSYFSQWLSHSSTRKIRIQLSIFLKSAGTCWTRCTKHENMN